MFLNNFIKNYFLYSYLLNISRISFLILNFESRITFSRKLSSSFSLTSLFARIINERKFYILITFLVFSPDTTREIFPQKFYLNNVAQVMNNFMEICHFIRSDS